MSSHKAILAHRSVVSLIFIASIFLATFVCPFGREHHFLMLRTATLKSNRKYQGSDWSLKKKHPDSIHLYARVCSLRKWEWLHGLATEIGIKR
jgi:hypothetical protein